MTPNPPINETHNKTAQTGNHHTHMTEERTGKNADPNQHTERREDTPDRIANHHHPPENTEAGAGPTQTKDENPLMNETEPDPDPPTRAKENNNRTEDTKTMTDTRNTAEPRRSAPYRG